MENGSTHFDIDPFLLNGLDDIGLTLRHEQELERFELNHGNGFWFLPNAQELPRRALS
jgi:3-isopropylmalate/(R)-2-methylmalate dehydratase small subunit